jgi:site-specific DNA-adenine methylase
MEKPTIIERFADNGEHSHYVLCDKDGNTLWSEAPEEDLINPIKSIQDKYDELCEEITKLQEQYDENGYDCSPVIKLHRLKDCMNYITKLKK